MTNHSECACEGDQIFAPGQGYRFRDHWFHLPTKTFIHSLRNPMPPAKHQVLRRARFPQEDSNRMKIGKFLSRPDVVVFLIFEWESVVSPIPHPHHPKLGTESGSLNDGKKRRSSPTMTAPVKYVKYVLVFVALALCKRGMVRLTAARRSN